MFSYFTIFCHFDCSGAEWRNLIQLQEIYSPVVNAFASLRSRLPVVARNDELVFIFFLSLFQQTDCNSSHPSE